jgi:sugar lactone lactonase YvrE
VLALLTVVATPLRPADKAKKQIATASATTTPAQPLVWPPPPDPPRIRWVSQFSKFSDVQPKKAKKKKGWFERLAGVQEEKEADPELLAPYGIAVDSRGRVYVADSKLAAVAVFDRKQERASLIRPSTIPLQLPIGLAVDENDRLFVSDAGGAAIFCFDSEGKLLKVFGQTKVKRPAGLAVDRTRQRLYVADAGGHRVAVFSTKTLALEKYIGDRSTAAGEPGKFHTPTNVAVDGRGNLYVTDTYNYRVQVFSRTGRFLRGFGTLGNGPGNFARPKGLAVDSEGHVYVADGVYNNVQVFNQEGEPLLFVGGLGTAPGRFPQIAGPSNDKHDPH